MFSPAKDLSLIFAKKKSFLTFFCNIVLWAIIVMTLFFQNKNHLFSEIVFSCKTKTMLSLKTPIFKIAEIS
jgi:hypothetical protein